MSLFGSLLGAGDMEDDPFFGSHMRTMRQMNNMMNSLFADPFGAMGMMSHHHHHHQPALSHFPMNPLGGMSLMPFGGFPQQNFNRLISGSLDSLGDAGHHGAPGSFHSSSTVISMTNGPDGRPQVYKATSSTHCAPGGIKETQSTVQDSITGTKKMAIGHHIGDRAHIIEREQNLRNGDREEREDFINLDEDDAEDFNREWVDKSRTIQAPNRLQNRNRHSYSGTGSAAGAPLAITAGPSRRANRERHSHSHSHGHGHGSHNIVSPRRSIRSSPLTATLSPTNVNVATAITTTPHTSSLAVTRGPYMHPHHAHQSARKQKNVKTVSGTPPPPPPPPPPSVD